MTKPIYCIRDLKVGFMQLVCDDNDETAKRGFAMAMTAPNDIRGFFPQDFQLYKVGLFDTQTGLISCDSIPELVMDGSAALAFCQKEG